jgi:peptidoglycan-N-acetylglucosamine deacetylase
MLPIFLLVLLSCVLAGKIYAQMVSSPGATSLFYPGGQYVMLTFSSGPHYFVTNLVLSILKAKNVKATFFVQGSKAMMNRKMLQRMHEDGHEIANQGFYHHLFTKLSHEKIVDHVKETSKLIVDITNTTVKHCRPPSGHSNAEVNQLLMKELKMKVILWSVDSKDTIERDPAVIIKNVVEKVKPGDVILMHDIMNKTSVALPGILDQLLAKGYEFLTIKAVTSFPDDSPH